MALEALPQELWAQIFANASVQQLSLTWMTSKVWALEAPKTLVGHSTVIDFRNVDNKASANGCMWFLTKLAAAEVLYRVVGLYLSPKEADDWALFIDSLNGFGKQLSGITMLSLPRMSLSRVVSVAEKFPSLRSLTLSEVYDPNAPINYAPFTRLHSLTLDDSFDMVQESVFEHLYNLTYLKVLGVDWYQSILGPQTTLQELELSYLRLREAPIGSLPPSITKLTIRSAHGGEFSWIGICNVICRFTQLRSLTFTQHSRLTVPTYVMLEKLTSLVNLTELDVMGYSMPHNSWAAFWPKFPKLRRIRVPDSQTAREEYTEYIKGHPQHSFRLSVVDQKRQIELAMQRTEARPPASVIDWPDTDDQYI